MYVNSLKRSGKIGGRQRDNTILNETQLKYTCYMLSNM